MIQIHYTQQDIVIFFNSIEATSTLTHRESRTTNGSIMVNWVILVSRRKQGIGIIRL